MKFLLRCATLALLALGISACAAATPAPPTPRPVFAPFILPHPAALITAAPTQAAATPTIFSSTPTLAPLASETPALSQTPPALPNPPVEVAAPSPTPLPPSGNPNETVNFLLIGSDKRPGASYRTDTLLVAMVWLDEGQVSLISIPRDLWVDIPQVGMQRINTAYQSGEAYGYPGGGAGLLKDTIAANLGIRIDYTAMVEFDGFRRIVDTLGGVEVPIACVYTDWRLIDPTYDPNDENNWWLYTVGPGKVFMDGDLALWYARARSKSNDFDRGRRQQEVLRALFNKALQSGTFGKIPQLYSDLSSSIVTDLGIGEALRLAPYALNFTNANIRGYYIRPPYVTSWTTPGGAAVLLPNEEPLRQMLAEAETLSPVAVARKAVTIELQNGTTLASYDALAASRLNYAGYQTFLSPAARQDYGASVLVDFTSAQDANQQRAILNALNLYSASVISLPNGSANAQYQVILGYDYNPCFQPQDLSH